MRAVEAEAEADGAEAADTAFLSLAAASGPLPDLVPLSGGDFSHKGVLIACTSAMNACQKGGEWKAALQIFSWARARQLQPDSFCYGIARNAKP